jgi:hypothetical protein
MYIRQNTALFEPLGFSHQEEPQGHLGTAPQRQTMMALDQIMSSFSLRMVSSLRVKWWFVAVVGHTIVIVLHDGGQC